MGVGRSLVSIVVATVALMLGAGCGEDERFSDGKIVDALELEETEAGYAIGGDPFCSVEPKLLNNADEVDSARDSDEVGLVIASAEGNIGVQGVPPFASDCKREAKAGLNKLDPRPKQE